MDYPPPLPRVTIVSHRAVGDVHTAATLAATQLSRVMREVAEKLRRDVERLAAKLLADLRLPTVPLALPSPLRREPTDPRLAWSWVAQEHAVLRRDQVVQGRRRRLTCRVRRGRS
jgi:hypothetical protein